MTGPAPDIPADPTDDLGLALRLADRADRITTAAFRRAGLRVETKADRTPVSEADRAVESDIRAVLDAERPDDRVVGEEFGDTGSGPRRWIIDPIDGTKNFVRRIPVWATLLALEVDGRITVGVVSAPALGRRWWAARGQGAFAADLPGGQPARIRVSAVGELADAHLSGNALSSWDGRGGPDRYVELALACYADRNLGDFWSHVLVAEGACDIGLDPVVSLWDLAALQVIVEEAGGRFTDFGGTARADGGSAVSTNGRLHDRALAILTGRPPGRD
ncbi:MAG TPA: inositol monophosphatase family protein [Acidimicrobiales bacterium]|nr:inositol monophosphatase family protein [Acidimicrobiales bacterium]